MLDLFFTNDSDLVSNIQTEDWPSFSDHRVVTIDVSYKTKHDCDSVEPQFLCDTGRRYKNLNFMLAPWDMIKEELESIDWADMELVAKQDTSVALELYHSKVLAVLEKHVPAKKKSSGRPKSKSRINKMRRTIWRRIAKIKRKILATPSIHSLTSLIQKKRELEKQLHADYSAENAQQEDQAIFNIKSNPKSSF